MRPILFGSYISSMLALLFIYHYLEVNSVRGIMFGAWRSRFNLCVCHMGYLLVAEDYIGALVDYMWVDAAHG